MEKIQLVKRLSCNLHDLVQSVNEEFYYMYIPNDARLAWVLLKAVCGICIKLSKKYTEYIPSVQDACEITYASELVQEVRVMLEHLTFCSLHNPRENIKATSLDLWCRLLTNVYQHSNVIWYTLNLHTGTYKLNKLSKGKIMSFQGKKKKGKSTKFGSVDKITFTPKGRFISTSANNVYSLDDDRTTGRWPFPNFVAMVHLRKEQFNNQAKAKHTSGAYTDKHYMNWPKLTRELNEKYVNI